jgi:ribosome recycling factor
MIEEVISELRQAIAKSQDALKRELAKLRTGRAHPGMLDTLRVDYYGQSTPIAQMATVGVPEARMLTVKPWDKSQMKALEKAIRESALGLNPMVDGELIRIPIPALSEERRRDLVKVAKKQGEECKVAIRKARHEAIDVLEEPKPVKASTRSFRIKRRTSSKSEDQYASQYPQKGLNGSSSQAESSDLPAGIEAGEEVIVTRFVFRIQPKTRSGASPRSAIFVFNGERQCGLRKILDSRFAHRALDAKLAARPRVESRCGTVMSIGVAPPRRRKPT